MNSLYNQLNNTAISLPNNVQQIKNMMNLVRNAQNPTMMLQNMMNQNPQMQQVMNIVRQSGGDPKTAFYNLAKQKGVDPNEILKMLK